jgi:hypothetical protein
LLLKSFSPEGVSYTPVTEIAMKLDYIRGHMGGNLIVLLRGDQIPVGQELEISKKIMSPEYLHAHETGILYPTGIAAEIEVKIVEPTLPCFISACGGFTQVLGAALIETELGLLFGINREAPLVEVLLHTGCGPTLLSIETLDCKALKIMTGMEYFVKECYERGVGPLICQGLDVMRVGKFLVINADRLKEFYPGADLIGWDIQTRNLILDIQDQFMTETGEVEPNVAIYDWNPVHSGDLRVIFPHYLRDNYIEPSCGTGSVALGLALLACGELKQPENVENKILSLNIESGGGIEIGGPDLTNLKIEITSGFISSAEFSHSRVEITATGEARL